MNKYKKPNFTDEQLAEFSNDFTEGLPMGVSGLVGLVHFWREEHDKVLHAYQNRMGEIALLAVPGIHHPNSWNK